MVLNVSSFYSGQQVEKAHDADLHCVDWNPHDVNLFLTGYYIFCPFFCIYFLYHGECYNEEC